MPSGLPLKWEVSFLLIQANAASLRGLIHALCGYQTMSRALQNENISLLAFRRFLESSSDTNSLGSLSAVTSRLPLNSFDIWESLIRTELWENAKTTQAPKWRIWRAAQREPSWLDLCSADGFIREKSLRSMLGAAPDGFLFSFALRRLNDWVPQVRMAAREHIPSIAACSQPEVIASALWSALPHFALWGRMTEEDRQVFLSLIAIEQVALSLKSRIINAKSEPSTKVLAQAGRTPVFDPWLNEIATRSIQPSTRAKAYRSLFEHRMVWTIGKKWVWTDLKWCKGAYQPAIEERQIKVTAPFMETLKAAISDHSPTVRRVGAEFFIRHIDSIGTDAQFLAEKLASDRSHYISERGKFALTKLDQAT